MNLNIKMVYVYVGRIIVVPAEILITCLSIVIFMIGIDFGNQFAFLQVLISNLTQKWQKSLSQSIFLKLSPTKYAIKWLVENKNIWHRYGYLLHEQFSLRKSNYSTNEVGEIVIWMPGILMLSLILDSAATF